jgi:hypothetical protein
MGGVIVVVGCTCGVVEKAGSRQQGGVVSHTPHKGFRQSFAPTGELGRKRAFPRCATCVRHHVEWQP